MNENLRVIFSMSVSGALTAVFIFALSRIFKRFISQSWRYYIWLIVLMRLLLPFSPQDSVVGRMISVFDKTPAWVLAEADDSDKYAPDMVTARDTTGSRLEMDVTDTDNIDITSTVIENVWLFWLCVSLVLLAQKTTKHYSFMKFIKSGGFSVTDSEILDIYAEVCDVMKIGRPPKIYINKIIVSPLLAGIFKPFIVLPGSGFSIQQLRYVFRHELTHYKRRDLLYKWLSQIVVCIHWFNPLVYMVVREINKRCELSLDESITKNMDVQEKQLYGDTLISAIKNSGSYFESVAVATMNENVKDLKERLVSIMNHSPRTKISIMLSISLAFFILTGAVFSGAYTNNHTVANESASTSETQDITTSPKPDKTEIHKVNESLLTAEASVQEINIDGGKYSFISFSIFSGYENGYIITIQATNMPYDSDEVEIFTGNGKDEKSFWVNDKTKPYITNKTVLDAVSRILQSRNDQNSGNLYGASGWHYLVTEISGPYKETADELANKFYEENNSSYFYAVSQKISEDTRKKLIDRAYGDDRISEFSALIGEVSGVDYDTFGSKAYNDDAISFFAIVSQYMSKAKKAELFNKSYVDEKISFFSVLIGEVSGVDYDAFGVKAYNDDAISFFSVVSQNMSEVKKAELFNKSYADEKISFFSVLIDEVSGVDYDALGVKAYNDDAISFFSVVSRNMSKAKKEELLNKSYADEKISFFSVLMGEVRGVDYDAFGIKSYNEDRIHFFSVLCGYMSKEVKTEILSRAYKENRISFFSLLSADTVSD